MVLLDMTVLSVAEPDLAESLRTSISGLQWVTTGYTVAFGALLLSAGAVADRYGADRVFRAGVTVFGVGSLLSSFAPTLSLLVVLRVVLGVAAAACVPASLAMIARLYPIPAERTRAVATWAAISGAAVAAGPIIGGALVDLAGWPAIFLVNVPITVVVLGMTAGPELRCPRGDRRIDWAAQAAACAVLALTTDALVAIGSPLHAVLSGAATVLAGFVFVRLEKRSSAPVLNPVLLRSGEVRAGLLVGGAVNFALNGCLFVIPLLLRQDHGLAAGIVFLPLTLPFALIPPLTGRIVARYGPRPPILVGMVLLTAGGVALSAGALSLGLAVTGLGVALVLPALVTAVVNAAPEGTAGAAGGVLNAARQSGATLGVAAMGSALPLGAAPALLLSAVVCAIALALSRKMYQ